MFDYLISFAYGAGFFAALIAFYILVLVGLAYTSGWRSRIWHSWPHSVRGIVKIVGWTALIVFFVVLAAVQGADIRDTI
jgi:hypothetical protein